MNSLDFKAFLAASAILILSTFTFSHLKDPTDFPDRTYEYTEEDPPTRQKSASEEEVKELKRALRALNKDLFTTNRRVEDITQKLGVLDLDIVRTEKPIASMPYDQGSADNWRPMAEVNATGRTFLHENKEATLIEDAISAEDVDPIWASFAVNELENALQLSEGEEYFVLDTECRSTLCRITLQTNSDGIDDEAIVNLERLIPLLPWNSGAWFSITAPGEIVGYIAREGYVLPNELEPVE